MVNNEQNGKEQVHNEFICVNSNCMHIDEKGCAVVEAYKSGLITFKELEQYRKEMRTRLFYDNKHEYKMRKDEFKLGVSKNFRNKKKFAKLEDKQIDEETKLANESEDDNDDRD